MSVSSSKMVYDFRRKSRSANSGRNREYHLPDIISYLNEALEIWFSNRVRYAQTNSRISDRLRPYLVPSKELSLTPKKDQGTLANYPKGLYARLNQEAVVKCAICPGVEKTIIPRIRQSDDIKEAKRNPLLGSNFHYEQLNAMEVPEGLMIYHDPTMSIKKLFIDYYREPRPIHAPSLVECADGEKAYYDYEGDRIDQDVDFESDARSADLIVDIAIALADGDNGDYQSAQSRIQTILQVEKNY